MDKLLDLIDDGGAQPPTKEILSRLQKLVEVHRDQSSVVERLTDDLKREQNRLNQLERVDIPQLMSEFGIDQITLTDGTKIRTTKKITASIPSENRTEALHWLTENGYGGIIDTKVIVQFPVEEREAAMSAYSQFLETFGNVQFDERVHPSRLRAFVKERVEAGDKNFPSDLFNVGSFDQAVIKSE